MKKRSRAPLFSWKLYVEGLRTLRTAGLLLCLACACAVALPPLLAGASSMAYRLRVLYGSYAPPEALLQLVQVTFLLPVFSLAGPPVLVFLLFSFLRNRAGSDCYHSLPCGRPCLCASFMAAVLTWLYAALALGIACAAVLARTVAPLVPLPLLGGALLFHMVTATLVAACALVGAACTGRLLPGVALGALVLYLPRALLAIFRLLAADASGMAAYNDFGVFFSPALHLPTASLTLLTLTDSIHVGMNPVELYTNAPGMLYSLGMAILALALGGWCFARRRSEMAGQGFLRPFARYALRAACILPLLAACPVLVWRRIVSVQLLYTALPVALVLYLLCERLLSKSWRYLRYLLPCLLIVSALAYGVVYAGTSVGTRHRQIPFAEDIVSVRLSAQTGSNTLFARVSDGTGLREAQAEAVAYTSPEMRAFIAQLFQDTLSRVTLGPVGAPPSWRISVIVATTDGQTLRRTLMLTSMQRTLLAQMVLDDPGYQAAVRALPEGTPALALRALDQAALPPEALPPIWDALREDLAEMGMHTFASITTSAWVLPDWMQESFPEVPALMVTFPQGARGLTSRYVIDVRTPRALTAYLQAVKQAHGETLLAYLREARDLLQDPNSAPFYYDIRFLPGIDRYGHMLLESRSISAWPRFSANDDARPVPFADETRYQNARRENDIALLDILARAALSEHSGERAMAISLQIPLEGPPGYSPVVTAYLTPGSLDDVVLLQSFAAAQ